MDSNSRGVGRTLGLPRRKACLPAGRFGKTEGFPEVLVLARAHLALARAHLWIDISVGLLELILLQDNKVANAQISILALDHRWSQLGSRGLRYRTRPLVWWCGPDDHLRSRGSLSSLRALHPPRTLQELRRQTNVIIEKLPDSVRGVFQYLILVFYIFFPLRGNAVGDENILELLLLDSLNLYETRGDSI